MIIDTHSHLHFEEFKNIDEDIAQMKANWVEISVFIWSDYSSTEEAIVLAKKHDCFKVVAWISHPIEASLIHDYEGEFEKICGQIESNRELIIWIWEAWLDYFHLDKENEEICVRNQEISFRENIRLAKKYNLPLIIHIRDAWDEAFKILKESEFTGNTVIHCYTWDLEIAQKFLSLGENIFIWFSWIVTFKNAKPVQETASIIPLERILVETDAPYLSPEPYRGKLNTSGNTKYVLDKIKSLRTEDPEAIENMIYENSKRFYSL